MHKPIRFGLDISDHSVELVGLSQQRGRVVIEWAGRLELPAGIVRRGIILDQERLVQALGQLFDGAFGAERGHLSVGLALPETQVYSKVFSLPSNLSHELAVKAAIIEASEVLPIYLNEAVTVVSELSGSADENHKDYFLAAVDRKTFNPYVQALNKLNVEVLFLESEAVCLSRALIESDNVDPAMIVDIGSDVTAMTVVDLGGVRMASVANVGGSNLTSALEVKMNISLEKAERFKRSDGFLPTKDKGRVFLILQQPMTEIIDELQETVKYYQNQSGRSIKKIILVGGNSLLPDIVDYIASNFPDAAVEIGQPFTGIELTEKQKAVGNESVLFSTAVGVAWRAAGLRSGVELNFLLKSNRQSPGSKDLLGFVRKAGLALSHMVKKKVTKKAQKAVKKPVKKPAKKAVAKKKPAKKPAKKPVKKAAKPPVVDEAMPVMESEAPQEPELDLEGVAGVAPEEEAATDVSIEEPPEEEKKEESGSIYRLGEVEESTGQGVGDVLQGLETEEEDVDTDISELEEEAEDEDMDEPVMEGSDKITVDTILARAKSDEGQSMRRAPYGRGSGGRGRLVALVILIVILAIATAGGVYMLMKTHGSNFASSFLFGKKDSGSELPLSESPKDKPLIPETISLTALLGTSAQPEGSKPFILTRAIEAELETSGLFDSTGQATTTTGQSEGVIKVVNTTKQDYTFVATTRFITEDGILFRLKEATPIPAEGSVDALVAADKPGAEYDIGPSKFTIPGLGSSYEDKIWGESETSMTGGAGLAKAVTSVDLVKAKADLLEKLEKEATEKLKELAQDDEAILSDLMTSEEVNFVAPEVDAISANFKAELKSRFRAMVLPQSQVEKMLVSELLTVLPENENQADYDIGLPQYTVEAYDTKAGLAEVRIEAQISKAFIAPPVENVE